MKKKWIVAGLVVLIVVIATLGYFGAKPTSPTEPAGNITPTQTITATTTTEPTPTAAPTTTPTHITEPTYTYAPVIHDYIYNPVEFSLAIGYTDEYHLNIFATWLNRSEEEIAAFQEKYGVKKGDTVTVRGVVDSAYNIYIKLGSGTWNVICFPPLDGDGWTTVPQPGDTVTIRGVVHDKGSHQLDNSELLTSP